LGIGIISRFQEVNLMAYSDFKLQEVVKKFNLKINGKIDLFADTP
jgi:hypothetical protein